LVIREDICLVVHIVNKEQIIDRCRAGINLEGSE
jgi:hypothetical protein